MPDIVGALIIDGCSLIASVTVTISFRVHGRKRPPSMRSSTVKKRPGRQPRPSAGPHPLPHELYIHLDDDSSDRPLRMDAHRSSVSDGSRSPPPLVQQQQHLRVIEQAIATGQRTQPARTPGLDYALSTRPRPNSEVSTLIQPRDDV
jgi:hypothetical protein